jgi:hypothetical protein
MISTETAVTTGKDSKPTSFPMLNLRNLKPGLHLENDFL